MLNRMLQGCALASLLFFLPGCSLLRDVGSLLPSSGKPSTPNVDTTNNKPSEDQFGTRAAAKAATANMPEADRQKYAELFFGMSRFCRSKAPGVAYPEELRVILDTAVENENIFASTYPQLVQAIATGAQNYKLDTSNPLDDQTRQGAENLFYYLGLGVLDGGK